MELKYQYSSKDISWKELSELYKVTLGLKKPADLETAFTNSLFKCFIFDKNKLIGAGRALADGIDCSYICDVAIHPKFQGLGVGKNTISELVKLSAGHKKIILYACPGKESFYKKLGFKRMSTAMAIFENQDQAVEDGLVNEA